MFIASAKYMLDVYIVNKIDYSTFKRSYLRTTDKHEPTHLHVPIHVPRHTCAHQHAHTYSLADSSSNTNEIHLISKFNYITYKEKRRTNERNNADAKADDADAKANNENAKANDANEKANDEYVKGQ